MDKGFHLDPPRRVTIVESILEQIVAQIQQGRLRPGDKLPSERQLMEMLGVSRSSVREALQGLAAMDLVEGRPGEGTFVKPLKSQNGLGLSIDALSSNLQREMRHHLNHARLILEQEIVTLAAEKIQESDGEAILAALKEYEASKHLASGAEGWPAHDQIHLTIARATGNPILARVLQTLLEVVPPSLRDKGFTVGRDEEVEARIAYEREIHRHLCETVIAGDAPAAREWTQKHADHEGMIIEAYYGGMMDGVTPRISTEHVS